MAPPGVVFLFDRPAPRGGARPVRYHNAINPPLETDRGAQPSVGQVSSVVVLLSQGPAGANILRENSPASPALVPELVQRQAAYNALGIANQIPETIVGALLDVTA